MDESKKISVIDYVVFAVSLLVPILIAVYYTFVKKQKSNATFLLADRSLNAVPISFSLAVSYLSAVTITGVPGEIAYHGWLFPFTWLLSSSLALVIVGNLFIPIFYKMKLTSVYEYLELRYQSRCVRLLASISYGLSIILYMGVVLYASCLALHTVTDLSIVALILIGGFVGTVYTVMGGLKTVVWTDLFQALVMITGLVAIIVRGSGLAGGMRRVWEVGIVTRRIEWANWDPSPFSRSTTLGIFCGQFVLWGAIFGCHQTQVQRYCATQSLKQARWALMISVVLLWILTGCAILAGLCIYATYWSCDPQSLGLIDKKDELVTFFVLDHLLHFYGLPGLFIASILSGSLSTISSGLNSLAAVIWEDILKQMSWTQSVTDSQQVMITRGLAAFAGALTVGLAILTSSGLSGVLQLGNTAMSVFAGPLLALFVLGFFTHTANRIGAISGLIIANVITIWLFIGSWVHGSQDSNTRLTTYTEGCITQEQDVEIGENSTYTGLVRSNVFLDVQAIVRNRTQAVKPFFYIPDGDWQTVLYSTSYHLYALIGFLVCLLVCLFVSLISRMFIQFKEVEPLLLHPLVRNHSRCKCCHLAEKDPSTATNGQHFMSHNQYVSGRCSSVYNQRRNFQLGLTPDRGEINYYNRWPSPSLPPTLKKVSKSESKKGLHLDGGFMTDDDDMGNVGVTIIAPSDVDDDDDSEIQFQSISSNNRKTSTSNGTLDRIDLGVNRQGILDSMSLNSVPVIVNNNNNNSNTLSKLNQSRGHLNRSQSKYEKDAPKLNESFSSDNFARRPSRCPSNRKLERRSDSEEEDVDVLTSDLDDNFSVDVDFVDAKSPPTKLNGRKIEIIHNKIIVNKNLNNFRKKPAETFSDEDGWTTDF